VLKEHNPFLADHEAKRHAPSRSSRWPAS